MVEANSHVIVFYAGHGFEFESHNHIAFVDCNPDNEQSKDGMFDVQMIINKLTSKIKPFMLSIILDCCREVRQTPKPPELTVVANPQVNKRGSGENNNSVGTNCMVVYATAARGVAYDGSGDNSVFTTHLLKFLCDKKYARYEIDRFFACVCKSMFDAHGIRPLRLSSFVDVVVTL